MIEDNELLAMESGPKSDETGRSVSNSDLLELAELMEELARRNEYAGVEKRFQPNTPYSIDNLPKHKAFFDATKLYREILLLGGNRCKIAGTKVWMADGSEKNIEDVIIGDKVLAFDVAANNLVETDVVDTYAGWADNVYYYHSDRNDSGFGATANHELLVKSPGSAPKKKQLQNLTCYDKAVVPAKWEKAGIVPEFSENVAKFLGLLVGDGYLCAREDAFKLTNTSEEILTFAEEVAQRELGLKTRRHHYKNCTDLYFTKPHKGNQKSALALLLKEVGLYGAKSADKSVPTCILNAPANYVRAFIQGLLAADGCYSVGRIDLYTTSISLVLTYQKALLRLGVTSAYSVKRHKNPKHADCYRVTVSGDSFLEVIGNSFHKTAKYAGSKKVKGFYRTRTIAEKYKLEDQQVYCITLAHPDHLFVANGYVTGNSGKTQSGAYLCAVVATGLYPDWWDGIRFDGPVNIWAVGKTGQTTRDTVQEALLGPVGAEGTGLIPKHCIGKKVRLPGTPNAYDTVEVLHEPTGKWSTIGFKSYKQDTPSFYGTAKHLVWLDEPCPEDIYNECLIRTATTNGRVVHTITPKEGLTRLLADFLANCDLLAGTERIEGIDKAMAMMAVESNQSQGGIKIAYDGGYVPAASHHRAAVAIGWDDIPWMSEQTKKEILESTPPHLRDTVSKGIPTIGDGAVYTIPLSDILLKKEEIFPIPAHYKKLYGMDVGWNRTAAVFGALDPDTGILYIYAEHYVEHQLPEVHASRIKQIAKDWMPGMIDPASNAVSGTDGKKLLDIYRREGLRLRTADNSVESGIMKVASMLAQGKLKFFPNATAHLQNEYLLYRRDNGKVVKEDDHAMDALRYLVTSLQFAVPSPSQSASKKLINTRASRYNV